MDNEDRIHTAEFKAHHFQACLHWPPHNSYPYINQLRILFLDTTGIYICNVYTEYYAYTAPDVTI